MYDLISVLILVAIILALAVMLVGMVGLVRRHREPPDHGWNTYVEPSPPSPTERQPSWTDPTWAVLDLNRTGVNA